jgi:hypothetical protein
LTDDLRFGKSAIGYRLSAIGYRLSAIGYRQKKLELPPAFNQFINMSSKLVEYLINTWILLMRKHKHCLTFFKACKSDIKSESRKQISDIRKQIAVSRKLYAESGKLIVYCREEIINTSLMRANNGRLFLALQASLSEPWMASRCLNSVKNFRNEIFKRCQK